MYYIYISRGQHYQEQTNENVQRPKPYQIKTSFCPVYFVCQFEALSTSHVLHSTCSY